MSFRLQQQQQKQSPTSLQHKLHHLSTPLHPLLRITTGQPHPSFPRTLLHYHLLSSSDLDSLASYYHQRTPNPYTHCYPLTENGRSLGWRREGMGVEEKRRKFGRFVGLRGCETPVTESEGGEGAEEVKERMEREWRRAMERGREEELWRGKVGGGGGGYY